MNHMTLLGNVGKEPEMTYTPSGLAVTKFSVADNLPKKKEQEKPETQWFNCVAFGNLAEIISKAVHKGSKVLVLGRFEARNYTTKDGRSGVSLDFTVSEVQFLDPKPPTGTPQQAEPEDFPF